MSQQENHYMEEGSVSQKVEISERTLSIIAFGFAVAAIVLALWAKQEASNSARETRLYLNQVMEMNAELKARKER
jgi:uncharacterized membrane protein